METTIRTRSGRILKTRLPVLLGVSMLVMAGCDDAATSRLEAADQARQARAQVRARETTPTTPARDFIPDTSAESRTRAGDPARNPQEQTNPTTPEAMGVGEPVTYASAEEAYGQGRYDEATMLFRAHTTTRPENTWGHYMLGLSAWKAGDLDVAEGALEEALMRDPDHVKSWINLGRVLLEQGRTGVAVEKVRQAAQLDPQSGNALRVLGRALHESGDIDGATTAYRRAIVIDGNDAWSMNNLGLLLIQDGRYDEALRALVTATRLRNDVAVFQNNLGVALERTGHTGPAADAYARAIELEESYERAHVSLDRVAALTLRSVDTLDLDRVAHAFTDEVDEWRTTLVDDTPARPEDSRPTTHSEVPGETDNNAHLAAVEEAEGDSTKGPTQAAPLPSGAGATPSHAEDLVVPAEDEATGPVNGSIQIP